MPGLSYSETLEAIQRGVAETIKETFEQIEAVFARDGECKVPVGITLTATGPNGQVDVLVKIDFVTNSDEKPPPFKAERIRQEKRIRLNPAQKPLPGQEV